MLLENSSPLQTDTSENNGEMVSGLRGQREQRFWEIIKTRLFGTGIFNGQERVCQKEPDSQKVFISRT